MEEIQARHRKEAKELQGKITGKKKQATKKTRKGVNDECARLEQELHDRHAAELAALDGSAPQDAEEEEDLTSVTADLSLDTNDKPTNTDDHPATTTTESAPSEPDSHTRKPNRARARMERRRAEQEALMAAAADEASALPDLKTSEREAMVEQFRSLGLVEKEIRADGHCLYSAFADQLSAAGLPLKEKTEQYKVARKEAGEYMLAHPDDFAPFLDESLEDYVHKVQDTGEWGGQLELLALARRYGVRINVLQGEGRVEAVGEGDAAQLWLAYYRHGFGLGEHYNSLRKVD